ncbi:MAG: hypothetical protein H6765_09000 [Candidatus Peribacteria bacterium]|nr:MAG: hypothetical protein H6765_09000 [Candidatus Peribacteria bacterium]
MYPICSVSGHDGGSKTICNSGVWSDDTDRDEVSTIGSGAGCDDMVIVASVFLSSSFVVS